MILRDGVSPETTESVEVSNSQRRPVGHSTPPASTNLFIARGILRTAKTSIHI